MTSPAPTVLAELTNRFSAAVTVHLIADRRGIQTWRMTFPDVTLAVKIGTSDDGNGNPCQLTAREAAVLTQLDSLRVTAHHIASGHTPGGSWVATRWFDGRSTWDHCAPLRHDPADQAARAEAVDAGRRLTAAVARLHQAGWTHRDLQPRHSIHHPYQQANLIDFALARGAAPITPHVPTAAGLCI